MFFTVAFLNKKEKPFLFSLSSMAYAVLCLLFLRDLKTFHPATMYSLINNN